MPPRKEHIMATGNKDEEQDTTAPTTTPGYDQETGTFHP